MTDEVDFKDFTKKRPEIAFGINGVKLYARPKLGIKTIQKIARLRISLASADDGEKFDRIVDMFALLLRPDSLAVFTELMDDPEDEVDGDDLTAMMNYVMERQGLRPTQPSSESSTSSPSGQPGIPGADGASPVA